MEDGGEYDRDGKRTNERTYAWRRIRPRPPLAREGRARPTSPASRKKFGAGFPSAETSFDICPRWMCIMAVSGRPFHCMQYCTPLRFCDGVCE